VHVLISQQPAAPSILRSRLLEISDPSSVSYGKFMGIDEIVEIVRPDASTVKPVVNYFEEIGAADFQLNRYQDALTTALPVAVANDLFSARMAVYVDEQGNRHVRSEKRPVVPPSLRAHVDAIAGLHEPFPVRSADATNGRHRQRQPKPAATNSNSSPSVPCLYEPGPTPSCLSEHYNITSQKGAATSVAVVEFANSYYLPSDLTKFQTIYGVPNQAVKETRGSGVPISPTAKAGTEASLDIQWIMAIGSYIPAVYIQIDESTSTPFLDWSIAENDNANTADVQSVSWGTEEIQYDDEVGVDRLNTELAKLGLRGVTVVVASGDNGAGCNGGSYMPNFPAASPYVLAVGGTWIPPVTSTYAIEGDSISGGGFATSVGNNRTQAPWQEDAVAAYQKSSACAKDSMYVASGRGLPDVAAFSAYYQYVKNGNGDQVDGTSASAPVWAGMIGLLNEARVKAGKSKMGFINPFLYGLEGTGAFTDITTGKNNEGGCLRTGYSATKGWDAVTGLGTPEYGALLEEAMKA
jgi:tripeptidyl-peptidase-1